MILAICASMIYTAPCVMLLMRVASIMRASGRGLGWALEIETILGPVKWHRADWRVSFGAQKVKITAIGVILAYFGKKVFHVN